jgi:transketolase
MDQLCVNTIRTLAMDAVQQANSGHPGTPMALAPVVYCLWQRVLRFDPDHPIWPNRDRFVLSVGHASMLLYSLLHLTGVKAVNPKYETLGRLSVTLDERLKAEGIKARVVSMPSWELFERYCVDHPEYRDEVLPSSVGARVSAEKGTTLGWARYVGSRGESVGMEAFGASAPLQELQKKFGFTPEHIVAAARRQMAEAR